MKNGLRRQMSDVAEKLAAQGNYLELLWLMRTDRNCAMAGFWGAANLHWPHARILPEGTSPTELSHLCFLSVVFLSP
jgi:hypothetical protein